MYSKKFHMPLSKKLIEKITKIDTNLFFTVLYSCPAKRSLICLTNEIVDTISRPQTIKFKKPMGRARE